MRLTMDQREPDPHGWIPYFSEDVRVEWGTLETGDLTLSAMPEAGMRGKEVHPGPLRLSWREPRTVRA